MAARLEAFPALAGLVRFGIVGASGVLVNLAVLVATLSFSGIGTGLALLLLVVARYLVCRGMVYRPPGLRTVSVETWLMPSLDEVGSR